MPSTPLKTLKTVFGYNSYLKGQEEIIAHTVGGGDSLVLMPTGGGKSLCYQLPSIIRDGTGVVVSPLISLMRDQVSALTEAGVRAASLNSTLSRKEASEIERAFLNGSLDLIYVAPERLMTNHFLSLADRANLALFAIDEAHCVSQWGHDFRKEYLGLSVLVERFPAVPRIALTATADSETKEEIIEKLDLKAARIFTTGFDRPNIRYSVTPKEKAKDRLLEFIEAEHPKEAGIIYCVSRKKAESTAEWFTAKGHLTLPYHAGLTTDERTRNQDRFLNEEGVTISATIAFGMGIDKSNVRFVAHLDMPRSIESYYQETGRAGRDGLPADAWMAYGMQDIVLQQRMIDNSDAPPKRKRIEKGKLDAILGFSESSGCRREVLLRYFGEDFSGPCENCDTCKNPIETWDGTLEAQKALSCIYRTGQHFGAAYLTDILTGKSNERIEGFGHDKLQVFGIGKEHDSRLWRSIFRQLLARGLAGIDTEGFNTLRLTEKARPVLSGTKEVFFRKDLIIERNKRRSARGATKDIAPSSSEGILLETLKAHRLKLATKQGVPPYVIFHDATLMEMATIRPACLEDMLDITGIARKKLQKYCQDFLDIIITAD